MSFDLGNIFSSDNMSKLNDFSKSNSFSFGDIWKPIQSGMSTVGDFYKNNKDFIDFGANAFYNNAMASEAKRMNNFYKSQYERQNRREEEAENEFALGFTNSNLYKS